MDDECKHDVYGSIHSILHIVDQKMECIRHKMMEYPLKRDQMLALVLYTGLKNIMSSNSHKNTMIIYCLLLGCDCNYDLCASQRKGDYHKWKWFDRCLWLAISRLSIRERGSFSVYSGLSGVKLDRKVVQNGYFVTYVSTSWQKDVSRRFIGDKGMLIQFDKAFKDNKDGYNLHALHCCDVSWISKFPDECEILFARSIFDDDNNFKCMVLDESNGIQTVLLTNTD